MNTLLQDYPWLVYLFYLALAVIAGVALYRLVKVTRWAINWAKSKLQPAPAQPPADLPEAGQLQGNIRQLSKILADLEQDSSQASILLLDAQTHTATLVSLVKGIALKAEAMGDELVSLQDALEAIAGQDPLKIAQAAGAVKDDHIRSLMLTSVRDAGFWQDTARLVATQAGSLHLWQQSYRQFVSNLLNEVSEAKTRLAASTAALELAGAGRPLLQAQNNLGEAQKLLQLQRRPALAHATSNLPAINAGLLR